MQQKGSLDDILVSVVVPVYNVEAFLPQCIDSLLAQTHPNLEIILVDDGSKDSSGAICDRYAAEHSCIQVIHKENGGLSDARNVGIAAAKGDYIGFVDSDDFVRPEMYRSLLQALCHGEAIATCGRYTTDEAGNLTGEEFTLDAPKTYIAAEAMNEILVGGPVDVAAWDKLYRKDLFDGITFPVGEINEDAAIIFRLVDKAEKIVHIGAPMYYYRGRSGSITKSGYKPNKIQALDHAKAIEQFVCHRNPQLKLACQRYTAYMCCQLLALMLKDPDAKKQYPEHYSRCMQGLRQNICRLYDNPNVSVAWKLRGTLIYAGIYGFIYRILR